MSRYDSRIARPLAAVDSRQARAVHAPAVGVGLSRPQVCVRHLLVRSQTGCVLWVAWAVGSVVCIFNVFVGFVWCFFFEEQLTRFGSREARQQQAGKKQKPAAVLGNQGSMPHTREGPHRHPLDHALVHDACVRRRFLSHAGARAIQKIKKRKNFFATSCCHLYFFDTGLQPQAGWLSLSTGPQRTRAHPTPTTRAHAKSSARAGG